MGSMVSKSFKQLKEKLRDKRKQLNKRLKSSHPGASKLLEEKGLRPHKLRKHAASILAGATLASGMLAQPGLAKSLPRVVADANAEGIVGAADQGKKLENFSLELQEVLSEASTQLNPWEEGRINELIKNAYGVDAVAELDGRRLLDQYGWTGYEQHLKRFPGDTLAQHDEEQIAGMAPGLGAWGYFADSKSAMTQEDYLREKYYVAVQTLYLPEWEQEQPDIKEWFKYRKVVMANPENGKAVVAVIGDAGPARWTGKVFGGSPEVMKELDLHQGPRKGKVVLLFLNDPGGSIPLGPLR